MNKPKTWHGLTYDQWFKVWDSVKWREQVADSLKRISRSTDAAMRERLVAIQTYSDAVMGGLLPMDPEFPTFVRDTMLEVISGDLQVDRPRKRRRMRSQLQACRWMLQCAGEMMQLRDDPGSRNPDSKAGPILA